MKGERVSVTVFARRCGCQVRCRLAARDRAVVTPGAGAERLTVIVANLPPGGFHMASFAAVGRSDMLTRFACGNRAVVAAGALARRAFEATADVAGRAIDAEMRSRKREPGGKMVKRCVSLCCRRRNEDRRQREHDAQPASQ